MKYIQVYENFINEAVAPRKLVLYHGVKNHADAASIMKNGFDLTKIRPNWTNDYAISTLTTPKSVERFFGRNITILRIEFEGNVGSPSDAHVSAKNAQDYTKQMVENGIDAVMLDGTGAKQVFIYNLDKIKKITIFSKEKVNESWEPKFDRQTIFDAIPWEDNNRDLYPGYSDERDINTASDDYWFETKEKAEEYADDLIDLYDSLPNPIPVYRAIQAKDETDIDLEYPGESWSHDRDSAYEFGRHNGSNFMLTATIEKEFVNWTGTIKAHVLFSGNFSNEDENEIVVDDQDQLKNIKIEPFKRKAA